MPKWVLSFYGQRFSITADSRKEAQEKAAKKLSKISGLHIPPSKLNVYKKPLSD